MVIPLLDILPREGENVKDIIIFIVCIWFNVAEIEFFFFFLRIGEE